MQIDFKPTKRQYEAYKLLTDNLTTELGYGGGAGGGKSYLGVFWVFSQCLSHAGVSYLIGRKELLNLKRTTLVTLFKLMDELKYKDYKYDQQASVITFPNGSRITLLDLGYKPSDPLYTRLGGLELTGAFVDESNECPEQGIQILKTRIGRGLNEKLNIHPKLLETFNPSKGHVYHRYYHPFKKGKEDEHKKFIPALPTDNPHLSPAYIEQLRNSDKQTRERLLYGNFDYEDDPAYLMTPDAITDLWSNTITQTSPTYISADVARLGADSTVIGVWKGLDLVEIHNHPQTTMDQVADYIKSLSVKYAVPYSHIIIDSDGIGGSVVDLLKGTKSFVANQRPFEIWDTRSNRKIPANFRNMKAQCTFKMAELINTHQVRISDGKHREEITQELNQIKQKDLDKGGKFHLVGKDEIKLAIGRSPDFSDMLMMRMFFEFKPPAKTQVQRDGTPVRHRPQRRFIRNLSV